MIAYKAETNLFKALREHHGELGQHGVAATLQLFFLKDQAGNHAYCNVCLAVLLLTGKLFAELHEDEGGPVLLSSVVQLRFATSGDLMGTCDYCDAPGEVR